MTDIQIHTERALYCFECSFHALFNVTQANCRLSYSIAENRCVLYQLVHVHVQWFRVSPLLLQAILHCTVSTLGRRGKSSVIIIIDGTIIILLCRRLTLMCTSQGVTELLWNFANFFLGNVYCSCMRVHVHVTPGTDTQ